MSGHINSKRQIQPFFRGLRLALMAISTAWFAAGIHAQVTADSSTMTVNRISFGDFFRLPIGPAGLEISQRLKNADRKVVQLTGYMVQQESVTPGQFLLTARPVQMSEHADGEADDLPAATARVRLDADRNNWVVPHIRGPIHLEGELQVGRQEDTNGRVYWVTLQLAPDATRHMGPLELANHLHARLHRH